MEIVDNLREKKWAHYVPTLQFDLITNVVVTHYKGIACTADAEFVLLIHLDCNVMSKLFSRT